MFEVSEGAILYDFFKVIGGGEKVTIALANEFSADVIVGFDKFGARDKLHLTTRGRLISLGVNSALSPVMLLRLIHAFYGKTKFLKKYSWVIYSGNYAPLAVCNSEFAYNVMYCHTIPRFIYDLNDYYRNQVWHGFEFIFDGFVKFMKARYEVAFGSMDCVIANSENVRRRIKKYMGVDSVVVYPPCQLDGKKWLGQDDYYLSVARLEKYKRVDKIVEAFIRMPDKKLVVASGGSEYGRLRSLARDANNIYFTGWVSDEELTRLMGKAIATLYLPIDEDFGMSPVESMAAGKPVIGVAEGGVLETVAHGETGILISPDMDIEDVIEAVNEMTPSYAMEMRMACESRARMFSSEIFYEKMRNLLASRV